LRLTYLLLQALALANVAKNSLNDILALKFGKAGVDLNSD